MLLLLLCFLPPLPLLLVPGVLLRTRLEPGSEEFILSCDGVEGVREEDDDVEVLLPVARVLEMLVDNLRVVEPGSESPRALRDDAEL